LSSLCTSNQKYDFTIRFYIDVISNYL